MHYRQGNSVETKCPNLGKCQKTMENVKTKYHDEVVFHDEGIFLLRAFASHDLRMAHVTNSLLVANQLHTSCW